VDDLVQVAALALVKAIERFDHERGVSFTTYAVPTIAGELKRHLRDTSWAAHVPQRMQERALRLGRESEELRARLGRAPSAEELGSALGLTSEEVAEAAEAASAHDAISLEWTPAGEDEPPHLVAGLGAEDGSYELVEDRAALAPAVRALPARERLILRLRFEHELTQGEIASLLGISQMHVSRLLRRSLGRLRAVALAQTA
jgi:RNA polymerase sigma-B factor